MILQLWTSQKNQHGTDAYDLVEVPHKSFDEFCEHALYEAGAGWIRGLYLVSYTDRDAHGDGQAKRFIKRRIPTLVNLSNYTRVQKCYFLFEDAPQ